MQKKSCVQCGKEFILQDSEIEFYDSRNLNLPKRCKECRTKNKNGGDLKNVRKREYANQYHKNNYQNKSYSKSYNQDNYYKRTGYIGNENQENSKIIKESTKAVDRIEPSNVSSQWKQSSVPNKKSNRGAWKKIVLAIIILAIIIVVGVQFN